MYYLKILIVTIFSIILSSIVLALTVILYVPSNMELLSFGDTGWGDELLRATFMTVMVALAAFFFGFFFIINAYFFSALSISEVFEDYIKNDKIKSVANKLLYASAVVIPLITIILISSL